MQVVATHLQQHALSHTEASEFDAFARSAFNRYYYAAFLITREWLKRLDSRHARIAHKTLPSLLQGSAKQSLQNALDRANKKRLITDQQYFRIQNTIHNALDELAALFDNAYALRSIADYEPETKITLQSGHYSLNGQSIRDASRWHANAGTWTAQLRKAMDAIAQ